MQTSSTPVWARDHTFLGVCEALGEDFGFNPFYLRALLGVGILWNPTAIFAAYAGLGLLVLISRFLAPVPRQAAAAQADAAPAREPAAADTDNEMALAA